MCCMCTCVCIVYKNMAERYISYSLVLYIMHKKFPKQSVLTNVHIATYYFLFIYSNTETLMYTAAMD